MLRLKYYIPKQMPPWSLLNLHQRNTMPPIVHMLGNRRDKLFEHHALVGLVRVVCFGIAVTSLTRFVLPERQQVIFGS